MWLLLRRRLSVPSPPAPMPPRNQARGPVWRTDRGYAEQASFPTRAALRLVPAPPAPVIAGWLRARAVAERHPPQRAGSPPEPRSMLRGRSGPRPIPVRWYQDSPVPVLQLSADGALPEAVPQPRLPARLLPSRAVPVVPRDRTKGSMQTTPRRTRRRARWPQRATLL